MLLSSWFNPPSVKPFRKTRNCLVELFYIAAAHSPCQQTAQAFQLLRRGSEERIMAQGASSPFAGSQTVSGPVAFLVLAGRNSMDRRETASAMEAASPAIDSLALHGAGIIAAAAAIVQSSYGEMVFRRQKAFLDAPEAQAVMEVFEFNMYASELLQELETLHTAWLSIPHVNSELAQGLLDSSTPLSLAFLSGLLKGSDSGSD